MRRHLLEAPVVVALTPLQYLVYGGRHVVVDAAPGNTAEVAKRLPVRIEHHLLGFARICDHQEITTVAQPNVRHFDRLQHPSKFHRLGGEIKLEGFPRAEHQRYEYRIRWLPTLALVTTHVGGYPSIRSAVAQLQQRLV